MAGEGVVDDSPGARLRRLRTTVIMVLAAARSGVTRSRVFLGDDLCRNWLRAGYEENAEEGWSELDRIRLYNGADLHGIPVFVTRRNVGVPQRRLFAKVPPSAAAASASSLW